MPGLDQVAGSMGGCHVLGFTSRSSDTGLTLQTPGHGDATDLEDKLENDLALSGSDRFIRQLLPYWLCNPYSCPPAILADEKTSA